MLRLDCCGILCVGIVYGCIGYTEYAVVFWMIIPTFDNGFWAPLNIIAYNCFLFLAWLAHLRTMITDPGIVPISKNEKSHHGKKAFNTGAGGSEDSDPCSETDLYPNTQHYVGEDWTICTRCSSWRPPRAHHCRICGRCIRKMDHHCPWVNNCVGEFNQKFFLQFVLYVAILAVYTIAIVIFSWVYHDENGTTGANGPRGEIMRHYKVIHTVCLSIEATLFGLFVLAVSCDQVQAIFNDETIVETLQRRSFRRRQVRRSKWKLLEGVCGQYHWTLWTLPCFSLPARRELVRFARQAKEKMNV